MTIDICGSLKCKDYSIHLITDKEPYGLEFYDINSYDEMFSSFSNAGYDQKIKYCAYMILACIENLDYVSFEYVSPNGKEKSFSVSVDEANEELAVAYSPEGEKYDIKSAVNNYASLASFAYTIESELETQYEYKYHSYCEETSQETIELLSNTPIDKKYRAILNNQVADLISECENYVEWGKAYEKQYKVIYKALLDYANNNSKLDSDTRKYLINAIKGVEDYPKYNDKTSALFYACEEIANGEGSIRSYIIATKYFREAREKTLKLAECAYLLEAEFEWVV